MQDKWGGDESNQNTAQEIPKEFTKINPLKFTKTQSFIISEQATLKLSPKNFMPKDF